MNVKYKENVIKTCFIMHTSPYIKCKVVDANHNLKTVLILYVPTNWNMKTCECSPLHHNLEKITVLVYGQWQVKEHDLVLCIHIVPSQCTMVGAGHLMCWLCARWSDFLIGCCVHKEQCQRIIISPPSQRLVCVRECNEKKQWYLQVLPVITAVDFVQ